MQLQKVKQWSTLTASCLLHFMLGSANTIANLNTYVISYLRHNGSDNVNYGQSVWFNAVGVTAFTVWTILSGFMAKKIGTRFTCVLGTLAFCGAMGLTSVSVKHSFATVLITIGLLQNIGNGLMYSTIVVNCIKWFDPNHKGLVVGLITASNAVSSLLFIQIQTFYLNPTNIMPNDDGYFDDPTLLSRVPKLFVFLSLIYGAFGLLGVCLLFDFKDIPQMNIQTIESIDDQSITDSIPTNSDNEPLVEVEACHPFRQYTVGRATSNRFFVLLWFTFSMSTQTTYFVNAMIKAFGQSYIRDDHYLAVVLSVSFIVNAVGAVFWGKVLDCLKFRDTIIVVNGILSVSIFSLIISSIFYKKLLFAIWLFSLYFTGVGIWAAYLPEVVRKFGDRNATTIYGLIHTGPAFLTVIMSPILQFLLNTIGWFVTFCTVGSFNTISMITLMVYYSYHCQ